MIHFAILFLFLLLLLYLQRKLTIKKLKLYILVCFAWFMQSSCVFSAYSLLIPIFIILRFLCLRSSLFFLFLWLLLLLFCFLYFLYFFLCRFYCVFCLNYFYHVSFRLPSFACFSLIHPFIAPFVLLPLFSLFFGFVFIVYSLLIPIFIILRFIFPLSPVFSYSSIYYSTCFASSSMYLIFFLISYFSYY